MGGDCLWKLLPQSLCSKRDAVLSLEVEKDLQKSMPHAAVSWLAGAVPVLPGREWERNCL